MFSREWQTKLLDYAIANHAIIRFQCQEDTRWWVAAINRFRRFFGFPGWVPNDRREETAKIIYEILTNPQPVVSEYDHEPF